MKENNIQGIKKKKYNLDLFTRKVIGHSMSASIASELVIGILDMGLKRQRLTDENDLIARKIRNI